MLYLGSKRNFPCVGYVTPPVVTDSLLLLTHSCMGLTLSLADWEELPQLQCMSFCAGTDHPKQNLPQQDLVPSESSLCMCHL